MRPALVGSFVAALSALLLAAACKSSPPEPKGPPDPNREGAQLVEVATVDTTIVIDLRYATPNNVFGRPLYPVAKCALRHDVAVRLSRVQKRLRADGLGLKIWDAYRPLSVQKEMWAMKPDARYVADPKRGSRHNRGAAVDVTLVDRKGYELVMPTAFDDFSEKASRTWMKASPDAISNRQILADAMVAEGFVGLPTEWWHFDSPDSLDYPVVDVPLESIAG
ncbi:MAG TPA: M15 family metallopeptidase [Planctomycetota bacterium]|nr:M15 family metallopeptidase [Planctomycetota bacterium]